MKAHDYIEEYLAGKLTSEQLVAFEQAMADDAELRSVVNNYTGIKIISEGLLENEILQEVREVSAKLEIDNSQIRSKELGEKHDFRKWVLLGIGLLVLALVVLFSYRAITKISIDEQKFFATYQKPLFLKNTRTVDIESLSEIDQAGYLFATNRYDEAELLLDELLASSKVASQKDSIYLLLGHVNIYQHDWNDAASYLKKSGFEEAIDIAKRIKDQ